MVRSFPRRANPPADLFTLARTRTRIVQQYANKGMIDMCHCSNPVTHLFSLIHFVMRIVIR